VVHPFAPREREHRLSEVGRDYLGSWQMALNGESEIAASGSDIQNTTRLPAGHHPGSLSPPPNVHPTAQKVIGEIVARRDAAEQGANGCRFPHMRVWEGRVHSWDG
jgi:hypothetical protein